MQPGKKRSGEWTADPEHSHANCPNTGAITEVRGAGRVGAWLLGVVLPVLFGVSAWAFSIAWGHEGKIVALDAKAQEAKEQAQRSESRSDRRMDELRDLILRVESKIDRGRQ